MYTVYIIQYYLLNDKGDSYQSGELQMTELLMTEGIDDGLPCGLQYRG